MSNEIYEVMEQETELEGIEYEEIDETTETNSRSKIGVTALIVGGALALGGLAFAGVKKLKNKNNADTPKKQKTRLKLVRVPVDAEGDDVYVPDEEFDEVEG